MLKDLLASKEAKMQEKIEAHLATGIQQLKQKMFNGAMVEFGKAMDLDFEAVYPKLLVELESAAAGGELEAALAVGLNMLKYKKDDFELANKLGNFARKNGDVKQATSLYKTALKINKKFTIAFYNLAAAEAKTELYDDMAANAVSQFKNQIDYILPEYHNNTDPVEELSDKVSASKHVRVKQEIQKITEQRNQAYDEGNLNEVRVLEQKIKALEQTSDKVTPTDICNEFKGLISKDPDNSTYHAFNMAIYALRNKLPDFVFEADQHYDEKAVPTKGLLKALALEQKGKQQEAIDAIVNELGSNELNRYLNVNLGILYKRAKNSFLSTKYLIKTADLLNQSDGLYNMYELLNSADKAYEQGQIKKALKFYKIASSEVLDPAIWNKIGSIFIEKEQIDNAIESFKKALEISPDNQSALNELQSLHDNFVTEGDKLMEEKKYSPAVEKYEKALSLFRVPETLKKAATAYRQLNAIKQSNQLLEECEQLEIKQKGEEQEKLRTALIIKSKLMMKEKKYQQAIEFLDTAFALKLDKNVYAQLAALIKRFKGKDSLAGLEKRWNDMVIAKEREEAAAREKERLRQEETAATEEETGGK